MSENKKVKSAYFTQEELPVLYKMEHNPKRVGDEWLDEGATKEDEDKSLHKQEVKKAKNKRRSERRKAKSGEPKERKPVERIGIDIDSQVANRKPLERRKCLLRSTIAECPTPAELRTAWILRNKSLENQLRLGGMMMVVECYVNNALIRKYDDKMPKIVGRKPGVLGWIREHCPELEPKYKTLQRWKNFTKRFLQELEILDPIPLSVLFDRSVSIDSLAEMEVQVQPRYSGKDGGEDQKKHDRDVESVGKIAYKYPWELSDILTDANHRLFRNNLNYSSIPDFYGKFPAYAAAIEKARKEIAGGISQDLRERITRKDKVIFKNSHDIADMCEDTNGEKKQSGTEGSIRDVAVEVARGVMDVSEKAVGMKPISEDEKEFGMVGRLGLRAVKGLKSGAKAALEGCSKLYDAWLVYKWK